MKRAAGITTGSGRAGSESAGSISLKHIYEIAKIKAADQDIQGLGLEQVRIESAFFDLVHVRDGAIAVQKVADASG